MVWVLCLPVPVIHVADLALWRYINSIQTDAANSTGVCGGIYYEGIYMVKVILTEIYMLEHFLWSFFVTECHNYDQIAQGIQKFSKIWSSWLITKDIHVLHGFLRRSEWKWLKEPLWKRSQSCWAFDLYGVPSKKNCTTISRGSGGKFWPMRLAGTRSEHPERVVFLNERGRKRVKEWC